MTNIKILNKENIESLIDMQMVIRAVENAYAQKSESKGSVWPLVFYEYEHNVFDLDIRSGNLDNDNLYGFKLISYNENNPGNNLPKVYATSMIFDSKTGMPLALLNAEPITVYRTGAAAGIGAKYLARKNSEQLLIVGCGNIVPYCIAATLITVPSIKKVYISNPHNIETAQRRLPEIIKTVSDILSKSNLELTAEINIVDNLEETTKLSDVIVTCTPSETAMIKQEWVKEGTHFSCMGAGMPNKQEIDEKVFTISQTFADDIKQCLEVGEAQTARRKNLISSFDGEIGDLILGKIIGRKDDKDITLFDSTGIFLQDLAVSLELLRKANIENIGFETDI